MKKLLVLILLTLCIGGYGQVIKIQKIDTIYYTDYPQVYKVDHNTVYLPSEYTAWPLFGNINYYYADNAATWIDLPTYCQSLLTPNDSSIIHPSVVDVVEKLGHTINGYRYYMVATPLPDWPVDTMERASIFATNDISDDASWVIPDGVTNPITPSYGLLISHDPDLLAANDSLYLLYTLDSGGGSQSDLMIARTKNGISWSIKNASITYNGLILSTVSILKIGNTYEIYCMEGTDIAERKIIKLTSNSLYSGWDKENDVFIDQTNTVLDTVTLFYPSHIDVDYDGNKYILTLFMRTWASMERFYEQLWFAESSVGDTFQLAKYPLFKKYYDSNLGSALGNTDWDMGYYRSCLLINDSSDIDCFYSGYSGGGLDYPVYIGHTKLKTRWAGDLVIDTPYNTISDFRIAQLDTANGLTNGYTFCDDFNRANSETINPSSCGKNWTIASGSFEITNTLCSRLATTGTYMWVNADSVNFEAKMNLKFNQTDFITDGQAKIWLKSNSTSQFLSLELGVNSTLVLRYTSSVNYVLERVYQSYLNKDDLNSLRWKIVGNNIKVWVNDQLYITHDLLVSETASQSDYNSFISGKRVTPLLYTNATGESILLKNFTLKNLNSIGK